MRDRGVNMVREASVPPPRVNRRGFPDYPFQHLYGRETGPGKGLEIHPVPEKLLIVHVGEVDFFRFGGDSPGGTESTEHSVMDAHEQIAQICRRQTADSPLPPR